MRNAVPRATFAAPISSELWAVGDTMAMAAAMMTGTRVARSHVLGSAWPQHHNRVIAQTLFGNIQRVGMPTWSEADQTLARALQRELGVEAQGLRVAADTVIAPPVPPDENRGGGSDDVGDVTWTLPTATLRFPSNIPSLPGHNWANAVAMATPIAHQGATAGAKALGMTLMDFVYAPALVDSARAYFNQQTQNHLYTPFIRTDDQPVTTMNADVMARFRPQMEPFYYNPPRGQTYLQQLGVRYPAVRAADGSCPVPTPR
ncbi:MAG: hypothetical protein WD934_09070 [Gemmatimonadales bacterium]